MPFNGMGKTEVAMGLRAGETRALFWKYFEMPLSLQVDSSKEKEPTEEEPGSGRTVGPANDPEVQSTCFKEQRAVHREVIKLRTKENKLAALSR